MKWHFYFSCNKLRYNHFKWNGTRRLKRDREVKDSPEAGEYQVDMKKNSVWKIIIEILGMQNVCANVDPGLLNDDQKKYRVHQATSICTYVLCRVTTADETWNFSNNPETKRKGVSGSIRRHRARRKKNIQSQNQSHIGHVLRFEGHLQHGVLVAVRERRRELCQRESWLLSPPRQCTASQSSEFPVVPVWEKHHRTGKTSLFTCFSP